MGCSWLPDTLQVAPSLPVHQQDWGEEGGEFDGKDLGADEDRKIPYQLITWAKLIWLGEINFNYCQLITKWKLERKILHQDIF